MRQGKTIVITGASRGIGLALARECLLHNHSVAALSRRPRDSGGLDELLRDYPERVIPLAVDVTDPDSLSAAADTIADRFPRGVDILVNNAGAMISREIPEAGEFRTTELETLFRVNTVAPLMVTQALLPLLRKSPAPQRLVMNVTSVMGSIARVAERRNYSYSVSKAALNMLTRLMHQDLRDEGINVFAIHPGWVRTEMGGEKAHFSPEESAAGLYARMLSWRPGDAELLDFRGEVLPW
ncbi:MAG: SDR family oxidoreductase [Spirochaetaceae bacterium]|nr:MAG: SDR family oxidoreductase [Spirochaetaceae bacterium]